MIDEKQMLPYFNLITAVLNEAYKDIRKENIYKYDAEIFLNSEWGEFLEDNITTFAKMFDKDGLNVKSVNLHI